MTEPLTPQRILDISISMMMSLRENTKWLAAQTQEQLADWIVEKFEACGYPSEPIGVLWAVFKDHPEPMTDTLMHSWDKVSRAIDAMVVAQPSRMTEASERLREAQAAHQDLITQESRRGR